MNLSREETQFLIDVLESSKTTDDGASKWDKVYKAITLLQSRLAEGEQEPEATKHRLMRRVNGPWVAASEWIPGAPCKDWIIVVTRSPEEWGIEHSQPPLSNKQIMSAFCTTPNTHQFIQAFKAGVRFSEKYHGV